MILVPVVQALVARTAVRGCALQLNVRGLVRVTADSPLSAIAAFVLPPTAFRGTPLSRREIF